MKERGENQQSIATTSVTPFEIRTHHLDSYMPIVQGISPQTLAIGERYILSSWRSSTEPTQRKYVHDVTGNKIKQHAKDIYNVLQTFNKLDDDHPVAITIGQKDEICKTCYFGQHCSLNNQEEYGGSADAVNHESLDMNKFLQKAKRQKLLDHIAITQEEVVFTDAPPKQVSRATTTARVVKKILSVWERRF